MSPKVVVAGANWVGDTLLSCARALSRLGADVTIVQTNALLTPDPLPPGRFAARRLSLLSRRPHGAFRRWRLRRRFESLRRELAAVLAGWKPQLLLALVGGNYPVYPDLLRQYPGIYKVAWMLDDPFTFSGPWSLGLAAFDSLYTVVESAVVALKLATGRPVRTLPLAADPGIYRPLGSGDASRVRFPLVFVGKSYRDSAAGLARAVLLERVRHLGLSVWGDAGWRYGHLPDSVNLSECYRGGPIPPRETNLVYNQATVVLNINHPQIRSGTSLRTFSIAASGAFQLVDWRPGLEGMFDLDDEIVSYRSGDELVVLVERFSVESARRQAVAVAGRARVLAQHTYDHRLAEILRDAGLIDSNLSCSPPRPGRVIWRGRETSAEPTA